VQSSIRACAPRAGCTNPSATTTNHRADRPRLDHARFRANAVVCSRGARALLGELEAATRRHDDDRVRELCGGSPRLSRPRSEGSCGEAAQGSVGRASMSDSVPIPRRGPETPPASGGRTSVRGPARNDPLHRPSDGAASGTPSGVLDSRWLTTGQKAVDFEEAVRARVGSGHAVAVNSAPPRCTSSWRRSETEPATRSSSDLTFASCGETVRYMNARRSRLADVIPSSHHRDRRRRSRAGLRPELRLDGLHFRGRDESGE